MDLATTFETIRPTIVAFGSRLVPAHGNEPPPFLPIIGTGFVVHKSGIVVTNRHVTDALQNLPRNPETGQSSAIAVIWPATQGLPDDTRDLQLLLPEIHASYSLSSFSCSGLFYGELLPDLAFVQLKVRSLPPVTLDQEENTLRAGRPIATAGFPTGSTALTVYGHLTQITPTLRHGIISAVYPFPCPRPQGFTIDITTQGGASGSPVFLDDSPVVVGMIEGYITEAPNITIAVPSHFIAGCLATLLKEGTINSSDFPTVEDWLQGTEARSGLEWKSLRLKRPKA